MNSRKISKTRRSSGSASASRFVAWSNYQWRKRLRVSEATERQVPGHDAGASRSATFLPLEVIGGGSAVNPTCIEIRLPSGVTVRVPEGVTEARLHALVRLLRGEDA